jgi:hypothetical protein
VPLACFTIPELHREVLARGIVAQISAVTLWRWLSADALQPWRHRSWIFPRDAQFAEKAGRVLDLYARTWDGTALGSDEFPFRVDVPQQRDDRGVYRHEERVGGLSALVMRSVNSKSSRY